MMLRLLYFFVLAGVVFWVIWRWFGGSLGDGGGDGGFFDWSDGDGCDDGGGDCGGGGDGGD